MECNTNGEYCILRCGSHLEFGAISSLKDVLQQSLASQKPIIFDAHEIVHIDTAALQLILAFTIAINRNQLTWEWDHPSPVLLKVANLLGMSNLLKLPSIEG